MQQQRQPPRGDPERQVTVSMLARLATTHLTPEQLADLIEQLEQALVTQAMEPQDHLIAERPRAYR